jgi:hypothetical protein
MLSMGGPSLSAKAIEIIRKAIHAHFASRGIPKHRFSELTFKWVDKKGWRMPHAAA